MTAPPDRDGDREERLFSGSAGRLALLLAAGWLTILLGRQAVPALLPTIIEELSISPSRAGFALTLMMGLYALFLYPAGRLSDALSRVTVLVASLGGIILGFGLLATVATYPHLLLGAAVVGVSSAFYFTPSRALVADLFVRRRGQALGVQSTAGLTGAAIAAGVAVLALRYATWQAAFLPSMVTLVAVGVLLHRWRPEPYVLGGVALGLDLWGTLGRLLGDRQLRRLLGMRALVAVTIQAVIGFLPAFLQFEKGLTPTGAGAGYAAFFVVGAASTPLSGGLSDRLGRLRVVAGSLLLSLVGLGSLLLADGFLAVVASTVALSAGLSSLVPVVQAFLMDHFPNESVGGDYGAAKTVFTGIGALGPAYIGIAVTQFGYLPAFASLGPVLLLAAVVLVTAGDAGGAAGRP